MAETNTRLPEEDRPELGGDVLRRGEGVGRRRGAHQPGGVGGTGSRRRRGDHPAGGSTGSGRARGGRSRGDHSGGGLYNDGGDRASPAELDDAESDAGLYNPDDKQGFFSRRRGKLKAYIKARRKRIIAASVIAAGGGTLAISGVMFLGIFNLPNFMKNLEQSAFMRYQIDMDGRSTAWLSAYMQLRFGEIDDPALAPKDRDNLLFRSHRISTNRPMMDWYKNLRGTTGKFEQEVFESRGIKFTSVAYRQGHSIKFRPGIMKIQGADRPLTFDPSQKAIQAIQHGDPNAFNGELRQFVDVEVLENDKAARIAIKDLAREHYPQWWKGIKRFHIRRDIQNMIGVRKWRFFENKRNQLHEKKVDVRNKILTQALPEDSKSGAFIKCLFGVSECSSSSDPADPEARAHNPTGKKRQGDKTDGNPDNPKAVGDGSGEGTLKAGADAAGAAGSAANKIISKLVSKAGLLSMLDSLARFDKAIRDHSLSKFVTQAKIAQAVGLYTVFGVAGDQLTTGQQSPEEVKAFMDKFQRPTGSEGWTTVINNKGASINKAKKKKFCSDEHQAWMKKHPEKAELEFQYQCPKDKAGGPNQASALEDAWNDGPGFILHPFLDAFHKATGGIFDVFNSVVDAVVSPAVNALLDVTGTKDDLASVVAYAGSKALEFGGGVLGIGEDSPSGQMANFVIAGGGGTAEASMRDQGAAEATKTTETYTQKQIVAYQEDQERSSSVFDRYLSLSNPKSLASTTLFALANTRFSDMAQSFSSIFADALAGPFNVLTHPAHAAIPNGYAACHFAGIKCFDFPKQCLSQKAPLDMTTWQATNADDLGILKRKELSWKLMTNSERWYDKLYSKVGEDDALKVWNCGLFDNAVRAGISAKYGYKGENAFASEGDSGSGGGGGSVTVSGDAQQIAQDLLSNNNVSYAFSAEDDVKLTAQGKPGTNGVPIDIRLLQIVAAIGKHHKIVVTAFESYGQGHSAGSDHYSGHAVDIDTIDGSEAYQTITDYWDIIQPYSKGAVFLQGDCSGAKPAPDGMDRQPGDVCNHQHISVGPAE